MAKCEICGATEDVRTCALMTGDRFGEPPKHPVCTPCILVWLEGGGTTAAEILKHRREVSP